MSRRKPPPPGQLSLLDYQAKVNQLIAETDSDPDYKRLTAVFRELAKEYDPTQTRL